MDENLKKRLLNSGNEEIYLEYNGSGDDGYITLVKNQKSISKKLEDDLLKYGYDLLQEIHGGWEINDGSYGQICIDIKNNKVKIDHNEIYQESNYSATERNI